MFNPQTTRADFPIFSTQLKSGKRLVYLDSAATSQKPRVVIDSIVKYYEHDNANVHRGIHELGDRSTHAWQTARMTIAGFFQAKPEELIITRNTTEALNGVALSWGEQYVGKDDLILATLMDHHSNLVPWQELAKRKGVSFELIPVTESGVLDLEWLEAKLKTDGSRLKILAFPHVSNTLGTINPVEKIVSLVRLYEKSSSGKAPVIVLDAAQSAPHMRLSFKSLGVDFMAVSAHKMLGPMGVGALFVREDLLKDFSPWLFGGGMIGEVTEKDTSFAEASEDRYTAGTPDVASCVGWASACRYLENLGMDNVFQHDQKLVEYALEHLSQVPEVTIVGPKASRSGSVAFIFAGVHAHDVAQILASEGVAVRSGHHCTMPLHKAFGWAATTRLSFNVYSTKMDIDVLITALEKVKQVFA